MKSTELRVGGRYILGGKNRKREFWRNISRDRRIQS